MALLEQGGWTRLPTVVTSMLTNDKLTEKEGKTIQGSEVDSLRKTCSNSELPNRNKRDGSPERNKEMWVSFPPQTPNENETVVNESSTAGVSDGNNLSLSESVKVDKYLKLEDVDTDEETCNGSLILPGEVEEMVTCCTPFFDKPIQPKFRALSVPQPPDSQTQELLGDDVQPFSLDEEFDYDNVALTPKFSEAELKAIMELSEEKTGVHFLDEDQEPYNSMSSLFIHKRDNLSDSGKIGMEIGQQLLIRIMWLINTPKPYIHPQGCSLSSPLAHRFVIVLCGREERRGEERRGEERRGEERRGEERRGEEKRREEKRREEKRREEKRAEQGEERKG
ncbi:hypothetical protein HGM15179_002280 [Zosterops borbonicus]|uniref:Uncharacterized protein n=1 Tax=Zosterops borbonicus TaxID=364589 RepID=A0A8K1LS56_9PASS|nr:hypothetical protein HGM15179_002280 [Zosterops borbonicus]